jgi:hypothetical protein
MKQRTLKSTTNKKIKVVVQDRVWGVHASLFENGEKIRGAYFSDREGESHEDYILREWGLDPRDFI